MKSQGRFALFDFVKLVLAALVINLHVESFLTGAPFSPLYYLGKFAVPLFITFNFYFNGKYYLGSTDSDIFIRKLKRILIPFAVWSLVGFILNPQLITLKYLARQIFMGTAVDAPLYYLLAIFWISLTYYLLSHFIKKIHLLHFGIITAVILYEVLGFNKIVASKLPIQIEFFISRILEFTKYASLGIILSLYQDKLILQLKKYSKTMAYLSLIMPLLIVAIYYNSNRNNIDYSDPWIFFASALITLTIILSSFKSLPAWVEKLAPYGTYSLGLYCLHSLFIDLVNLHFPSIISYGYPLISLAIIAFSLAISISISRFPKLTPLVQ